MKIATNTKQTLIRDLEQRINDLETKLTKTKRPHSTRTVYVDQIIWDKAKEILGNKKISLSAYIMNHLRALVQSDDSTNGLSRRYNLTDKLRDK